MRLTRLLALLLLPLGAWAQTSVNGQITENVSAAQPSGCADGDFYFTHDTGTLQDCHPAGTWNIFGVGSGSGPQYSIATGGGIGNPLVFVTPTYGPGQIYCFYNLVSSTPAGITCSLAGLLPRPIQGATATDTMLYSDNQSVVEHDAAATSAVVESIPTPAALGNSGYYSSYRNHTNFTDSIVGLAGSGFTVNGTSSWPVPPNVSCTISVDLVNTSNWLVDCPPSSGGSSSAPFVALTDAATINWPVSGPTSNATLTITGNHSLSITGATNGWKGTLLVTQDSTGSRQLSVPAGFAIQGGVTTGIVPLSTTANAVDEMDVAYTGATYYVKTPFTNFTTASGGAPTFTPVETVQNFSTSCSTGVTATFGTNTTAGELIVLSYFGGSSGGAMTITDSGSESYTKAYERTSVGAHYTTGLAYFLTTASGISTVTVSGGSNTNCGLVVQHWRRSSGSWAIDQIAAASATGQGTPWSSPVFTTTSANEVLIGSAFAEHGSGSTCSMTATGSWTGHLSAADGNGNLTQLSSQTVSSIQTNIANTGTTITCTAVGTFPGAVSFK